VGAAKMKKCKIRLEPFPVCFRDFEIKYWDIEVSNDDGSIDYLTVNKSQLLLLLGIQENYEPYS